MKRLATWFTLTIASAVVGCSGDAATLPAASLRNDAATLGADRITVLSRNLYIGADLNPAIAALASSSPADDIPAIVTTVNEINAVNWPRRVQALAAEIVRARPHVVGLQEVWTVNVNLTPIGVPVALHLDFLTDLMNELQAAGMSYAVAAAVTSIDAAPNPLVGVRDRDVILVDTERVSVVPGTIELQNYAVNLGTVAPGTTILRGWATLQATIEGMPIWISSTHFEAGRAPGLSALRAGQAQQLIASLAGRSPAILLGDLNDDEGSAMYQIVTGAGFRDTWREMRPGVAGLTCCHVEDLSNASAAESFTQRIDYVFTRGLAFRNGEVLGRIDLTGQLASDRVDGVLWPSDHAGVLASVLLPPSR